MMRIRRVMKKSKREKVRKKEKNKILEQLTVEAQKLGMGY
jgi:hypothetical protein